MGPQWHRNLDHNKFWVCRLVHCDVAPIDFWGQRGSMGCYVMLHHVSLVLAILEHDLPKFSATHHADGQATLTLTRHDPILSLQLWSMS